MPTESDVIETAIELANLGLWVFPCNPSNKRPMTKNGFKDAVNRPEEVRALFEWAGDTALIGVKTGADSDILCIDFDLYKSDAAKQYMEQLIEKGLLPDTRIHRTRSGGVHVLYRGNGAGYPSVVPNDAVDVKGDGGYIIWWPAHGEPVIKEGMVEAPPSLIKFLINSRKQQSADSIEHLEQKIRSADNFHDSLARLAAKLSGAGWAPEDVQKRLITVLEGSVAASSQHPRHDRWKGLLENKENELTRIVNTSHSKFNSKAQSDAMADAADLDKLKAIAGKLGFTSPPQGGDTPERPKIKQVEDFGDGWPFDNEGYFADHNHDLLTQRFVMHPVLCEDESVLIAAEPKTGKTAIALTVGLHIACGLDLGSSLRVAEPRGVLYFGLEGRRAIRLRIAAWRLWMAERGVVLPERIPLYVVERTTNLLLEEERQTLANKIKAGELWMENNCNGISIGAIFFDTYTKTMPGGDQNSVEDTSAVFDVVSRIRENGTRAAVAFIHHKARAGNIRGSTNIEADPDVLTSVFKQGDKIVWSLDRARSVEEGGSYHFTVHNYSLGDSNQGFAINAPVVEAIDAPVEGAVDYKSAQDTNQVMTFLLSLGAGRHELKAVYEVLFAQGLAPVSPLRRGSGKLKVNSERVQQYFHDLIPDKGYVFAGKSFEKIVEAGSIAAIFIR